jgi:hypothetical protein
VGALNDLQYQAKKTATAAIMRTLSAANAQEPDFAALMKGTVDASVIDAALGSPDTYVAPAVQPAPEPELTNGVEQAQTVRLKT